MTSSEAVAKALLLKRDGAVLLITLNRPERCNAVNRQMWRELREAFIGARADAGPARRGGDRQRRGLLCRPGPGRDDGRGRPGVRRPDGRAVRFRQAAAGGGERSRVGFGLTFLLYCDVVYVAEGARPRPPSGGRGLVC